MSTIEKSNNLASVGRLDVETLSYGELITGDAHDVLETLEPASVPLTLFSPPYDGIRDYNNQWEFDFQRLGDQLLHVTSDGGVCAVVIGDGTKNFAKSLTTFRWATDWVDRAGWKLFECCIYARHGNPGAWWSQRFRVDHEYILIFFKGKRPRHFEKAHTMIRSIHAGKVYTGTDRLTSGGFKQIKPKAVNEKKCRGTIWHYATSNTEGNRLKLQHPATFPDELARDLVLCFTQPGEIVLDPMCGSGTTCVVSQQAGRSFIGIEINPEYSAIAKTRIHRECTDDATLF